MGSLVGQTTIFLISMMKFPPQAGEVKIVMEDQCVSDDYISDIINSLTKKVYVGSYCEKCGFKIKRSDFDNQGEK